MEVCVDERHISPESIGQVVVWPRVLAGLTRVSGLSLVLWDSLGEREAVMGKMNKSQLQAWFLL